MTEAGKTMRDHLSKLYFESLMQPSPLYSFLTKDLPEPTRWQRFKNRIRSKIENSRIWLSKRIYDWSSYEDQW